MSPVRRCATAAAALALAVAIPISPLYPQDNDIKADRDFIRQAGASNWLEIRLGEVARDRATNSSVKQFGQRMVIDHTNLQSQLNSLTGNEGDFKPRLNQLDLDEVKRFQRLSGAEFDRAYMTAMIRHHEKDVSLFQNQAQSARSAQVRDLVSRNLPLLQQHLSQALQVAPQAGVTTGVAVATPDAPTEQRTDTVRDDNSPWAGVKPDRRTPQPAQPETRQEQDVQDVQGYRDPAAAARGAVAEDAKFIRNVAADNHLETQLGELAARKAKNSAVRDYGKRVANDREAMQDRWVRMASQNGLTIGRGMGPRHRAKLERLEKMTGDAFDRAYMQMQVQSNEDYRTYFQKEGRAANSSEVRALVNRDLSNLQEHTNRSRQIADRVGVNVDAALRARHTEAYRRQ